MKIVLPTPHLLSNNKFYAGMHHKLRRAIADEWHLAVKAAIMNQSEGELPGEFPVRIIYEVYAPNRKMDIDNVSTKAILDGLVIHSILPNDSLDYVQEIITAFRGVDKSDPRIEITIETIKQDVLFDEVPGAPANF